MASATLAPSLTPADTAAPTLAPTEVSLLPSDTPETPSPTVTDTPEPPTPLPPTNTPEPPTPLPPTDTPEPTNTDTLLPPTATLAPSNTPEPTNTATLAPTDTPQPSDTPLPTSTDTVQPPTNTPLPTETPLPTSTEVPGATSTPTSTATVLPTETPGTSATPMPVKTYGNSTSLEPISLSETLTLDKVVSGTIDDDHPAVLYAFTATAGLVVDVEMRVVEGDLDPFLIVLDPKGREIARNDDLDDSDPNSAIMPLTLVEKGTYVIVATRFFEDFGDSSGTYDIAITTVDPLSDRFGTFSQALGYNSTVNGALNDDVAEQIFTFRGVAGDVISIQTTQTSGDLDTNIALTTNLGMELVYNDDNLLSNSINSLIQSYILPRSGYYSIVVGRYSEDDNAGNYRLRLTRDSQNTGSIYAILDPVNSRSLKEDFSLFTTFYIGDQIDDDGRERTIQALLTFRLPPLNDQPLASASFQMEPCQETGGGFAELGALSVYQGNYGDVHETRNIIRPQPGARVVGTQTSCAPLDLTSVVQDAYANGAGEVQLRLIFRNHTDNGADDRINFTPALLLTFGS